MTVSNSSKRSVTYHRSDFPKARQSVRLVSMAQRFRESYHFDAGLEQAVIDLVRVGSTGFGSGVRQLATRLARTVPPSVEDPERFRTALYDALSQTSARTGLRFAPGELPTDDGSTHALARVDPQPDGSGLALAKETMTALNEITQERQRAPELIRAGVSLTRTVLLDGPPGVGKTMTARWLAEHIGVPLVTMDLSAVVSSFLGSSGRNIRSVLDYGKSGDCVLLLDEFDAIAKRRDDDTDIGELKRVVNVILVELDRWPDSNLLVAATNHRHLLDPAVGRRFDRHIELGLPGKDQRLEILTYLAIGSDAENSPVIDVIAEVTDGLTGSDIARLWNTARRRAVLDDHKTTDELAKEAGRYAGTKGAARDRLWLLMSNNLGISIRQIAATAGVSHPTVSAAIKRSKIREEA